MKKYVDMKEALEWEEAPQDEIVEEDFSPGAPPIQKCLWNLFEHPHTSMAARIVGIISVRLELKYFHVITTDYNSLTLIIITRYTHSAAFSCIFLSTIILTLDTMPYFMDHEDKIMGQFSPFVIVEAIYMVWFTLEFIIRLSCCPSKVSFCKKVMNWIDLLGRNSSLKA